MVRIGICYSNDGGPGEEIEANMDGVSFGSFVADNTRPQNSGAGSGWNNFFGEVTSEPISMTAGEHTLVLEVIQDSGDGWGVEVDAIFFFVTQ